jgi:hypothetical protein
MKRKKEPLLTLKSYSLDVAFSSATRSLPKQGSQPIYAMGYGFSEFPGGIWEGKGQATLKVKPGSLFYFTAFDTSSRPHKVTTFEVDFHGGETPFDSTGPIKVTGKKIASQTGQSAGCNVIGLYSMIGPYVVAPEKTTRNFDCTVKVTVNTTRQRKTFQVDPEVQVEGGE